MNALSYTSVHQLTYLFLKTAQGYITNEYLNDSFQPFLVDLSQGITKNDSDVSVARESFLEELTEGNFPLDKMDELLVQLNSTVENILGDSDATLSNFFKDLFEESKTILSAE